MTELTATVVIESLLRATADDATPIIRRLARNQARVFLDSRAGGVFKDTVAFVQEWMMSGDHEADQWHRDFAAAINARTATPDPAKLAELFCATPLPESVAADLCATQPGSGRYGTNLLTVAEATTVLRHALAATPAPAVDAVPAGEVAKFLASAFYDDPVSDEHMAYCREVAADLAALSHGEGRE